MPCGDWIAAVVTAQWLMFEERGLLVGAALRGSGASLRVVPVLGVGACLEGLGWEPALRVVPALRGGGAALW